MQAIRAIRVLVAIWFAVVAMRSGADTFQVDNWTVEQRLPDSSVTGIAQTPHGYLWVRSFTKLFHTITIRL